MVTTIFKGDDTNAFGGEFLTINAKIPEGYSVSKAEFQCGNILLEFDNPEFPLLINLDREQTKALDLQNVCYLRVYDDNGFRQTCKGRLTFIANDEVVLSDETQGDDENQDEETQEESASTQEESASTQEEVVSND